MAAKAAMPHFKTVDDYINHQSADAQKVLSEIIRLIKEAVPEAREISNYKVPAFILVPDKKPKLQLMAVAYANFVSFYPYQACIDHFTDELKDFELGKGTVKFSFDQVLPADLIKRMVVFRKEEILGD